MGSRSLLPFLLVTACQAAPAGSSGFSSTLNGTTAAASSSGEGSTGTGSGGASGTSSGGGSTNNSTGSDGTAETTSPILDVGSSTDIGDGKPVGCKGKIDFLFVISRDAEMKLAQTRLLDAFPKFIATIQAKFKDFDYHIMVVDGDQGWGHEPCNEDCGQWFCEANDYPCDLLGLVTECDETLGAGNVFGAGYNATNKPCVIAGGKRYLTRDQADLAETFACIAQLGSSGRGWIGEALTAAMGPALGWPGACNEGFLRDDALLMVTLVAANWDQEGKPNGSAGTPEEWYEAVLAGKKGDPESVVMFSLLDPNCPPQDRTCQLVKMFPYSSVEYTGVADYGPAFDTATDLLEAACADFEPPG